MLVAVFNRRYSGNPDDYAPRWLRVVLVPVVVFDGLRTRQCIPTRSR